MIKLLSVKTCRPGSTREAFRQHYENRHIPLGLGFIDRFRWRKYVRNHVVAVHSGQVDFDCLTEFWFASREDQESTRTFAASPAFRVLDEDDARFLDVTRRLSFELEERLVAGERPVVDAAGTRRVAAIFSRPESIGVEDFARSIRAEVECVASRAIPAGARVALDLRLQPGPRPTELAAIVSTWSPPGASPMRLSGWLDFDPVAEVELEVVETPPDRLWSPS